MDQSKIGAFISKLRTEQGLTQEQLGERVGVSQRTVSRWETGRNMPDYSLLFPICEVLGVNVAELLSGERMEHQQVEKETVTSTVETVIRIADAKRIFKYVLGAVISLLLTLIAMFCLYQSEFNITLGSTVDLENVINEFQFSGYIKSDVIESQTIGRYLVVLYQQSQSSGGSGRAILEKGIFGTYRILHISNTNNKLICRGEQKIGKKTYAILSCVNDLPDVKAYGIYGYHQDKQYDSHYDNPGDILFQEPLNSTPFLLVKELPADCELNPWTVGYVLEDGKELLEMNYQESVDYQPASGANTSVTDVAEAGVIYELIGVIFLVGMLFVLAFLRGLKK